MSNFASVKFVSVKQKFAFIAKKLTSTGYLTYNYQKFACFNMLHIRQKWEQPLMNAFEIATLFESAMDCIKNLIFSEAAIERCSSK